MAVLHDSLWVADDLVVGGSPGVAQTFTQDVASFGTDVNDPTWPTPPGSAGFRTAWLKAVVTSRRLLQIDTATSNYDTVLALWAWDGSTTPTELLTADDNDDALTSSRIAHPVEAGTYLIGVSQKASDPVNTSLVLHVTFSVASRTSAGLLLRGAGGAAFTSARQFDLGGIGIATSPRPFDVITPLLKRISNRPFDVAGTVGATSSRPFDLGTGGLRVSSPRPFDVIDATNAQVFEPIVYVPPTDMIPAAYLSGIQVYDKAGVRLGAITTFSLQRPPSGGIKFRGSFGFTVPRVLVNATTGALYDNPDTALIPDDVVTRGDRLVVIGNSARPSEPWGGVMTDVEWTDGAAIVQCADVMDLLTTPPLPEDNAARATSAILIPDQTPAANVISLLMAHANVWFGANGEVRWGVDATGSLTFFGRETIGGDLLSAIELVAQRSFGEWAWRIELSPGRMRPVLVWRDKFLGPTGPALADGPDGNVVAGPALSVALTSVINAIRLTGSVTRIESKIPEGARALPVAELIPVAEVWWPTAGYRRRRNDMSAGLLMNIDVPWTLEDDTQAQLAAEQDAKMRALFKKFIRAFHEQYGRPWHDGWSWAGGNGNDQDLADTLPDDEDFERRLTLDKYVHYRALALSGVTSINGSAEEAANPIAIVMKGRTAAYGYVKVSYDRVNDRQRVWTTRVAAEVPSETVFRFEWRRYLQGEYDPLSDGVGEETPFKTVKGGVLQARSWRIVPYGLGDKSGSTQLLYGITASTTQVPVVSLYPLPSIFPYEVTVGSDEKMLVNGSNLTTGVLTVVRGYGGTTASIHERGESVEYNVEDATVDDTTGVAEDLPPQEIPWPRGVEYATKLLQMLHRPRRLQPVRLANVGGAWSEVALGSQHPVDIELEGPAGGTIGTVRVVGIAPDWVAGSMELVLEDVW